HVGAVAEPGDGGQRGPHLHGRGAAGAGPAVDGPRHRRLAAAGRRVCVGQRRRAGRAPPGRRIARRGMARPRRGCREARLAPRRGGDRRLPLLRPAARVDAGPARVRDRGDGDLLRHDPERPAARTVGRAASGGGGWLVAAAIRSRAPRRLRRVVPLVRAVGDAAGLRRRVLAARDRRRALSGGRAAGVVPTHGTARGRGVDTGHLEADAERVARRHRRVRDREAGEHRLRSADRAGQPHRDGAGGGHAHLGAVVVRGVDLASDGREVGAASGRGLVERHREPLLGVRRRCRRGQRGGVGVAGRQSDLADPAGDGEL
ncbi:hypothetical protein FF38_10550, partial [Lucilia cuprina]